MMIFSKRRASACWIASPGERPDLIGNPVRGDLDIDDDEHGLRLRRSGDAAFFAQFEQNLEIHSNGDDPVLGKTWLQRQRA